MDKQAALEQHALEQLRRGDLRSAHQTLSTLLRYRPNDAQLRNRIQQVEQLVRQREEAQARIQAEPLRYAHAYIQAGRLVEGLKLLRAALAKDPANQRLRDLALEVAARLRKQAESPNRSQVPRSAGATPRRPPDQNPQTPLPVAPEMPTAGPEEVRQEAIRKARREAELRARASASAAPDPVRQEAVARAKAQAEARARSLSSDPPAPESASPAPQRVSPPVASLHQEQGAGGYANGTAPHPSQWTFDLTEDDPEDLEQTEVGPPPDAAPAVSPSIVEDQPTPRSDQIPILEPEEDETHTLGLDMPAPVTLGGDEPMPAPSERSGPPAEPEGARVVEFAPRSAAGRSPTFGAPRAEVARSEGGQAEVVSIASQVIAGSRDGRARSRRARLEKLLERVRSRARSGLHNG